MSTPVTDGGTSDVLSANIRNDSPLAALEALLPARDPALRERTHRILTARRLGQLCALCGQPLAPDAPVWMESCYIGPSMFTGIPRSWQAPVCEACAPRDRHSRRWVAPAPCAGCQRPVYYPRSYRWRLRAHCSERCRLDAWNQRRRAERAAERRFRCATCGATFTPPRADGRYCSPACRQRAYRQRQHGGAPAHGGA